MCGICGQLRFDGQPADTGLVGQMRARLRHRGPDDEGLWFHNFDGGAVALGHKRLAILDLSDAGHQPMCDPTGRFWIVYNGEVYNYREIRQTLVKSGHAFNTATDTEVVLAAYIQYGADCLGFFNGMFAFAIWDKRNLSLFCGRDRLGIKPFYYTWRDDSFHFASEIKALLSGSNASAPPNHDTLYDYLSLGIMHHGEKTFYEGIEQLSAGCHLKLDATGKSVNRYWKLGGGEIENRREPDLETLDHLLKDAVKLRLRSDVPVGILLSGGLDSSSLTALACRNGDKKPHAFSLKFHDDEFDESAHAEIIAAHCNSRLKFLTPRGRGLWDELDALIMAQDSPTHAPEVYSNWCMMRAVGKRGAKVLLTGQGGDELFGGYNWYPKYLLASLLRKARFGALIKELRFLPEKFPNPNTKNKIRLLGGMLHALLPVSVKSRLKPEFNCLDKIMHRRLRAGMRDRDFLNLSLLDPSSLEEKMHNDLVNCNIPHYLHYEDANSMAFGIEERVPFLDHRLVEFTHAIAARWKIQGGVSKALLRQVMSSHLPEQILNRRDKMGLSAPKNSWFRNELKPYINKLFMEDCRVYDLWINRHPFLEQLNAYMQGKSSAISRVLWRCINLEKWLRINY